MSQNPFETITDRLSSIENLLHTLKDRQAEATRNTDQIKKWLDLNELIEYDPAKRTKATWYSKISKGEVPFHKRGKKVYFLKSEIDEWLMAGRCETARELAENAHVYLTKKKGGQRNGR